jgi:hypothetical protein
MHLAKVQRLFVIRNSHRLKSGNKEAQYAFFRVFGEGFFAFQLLYYKKRSLNN